MPFSARRTHRSCGRPSPVAPPRRARKLRCGRAPPEACRVRADAATTNSAQAARRKLFKKESEVTDALQKNLTATVRLYLTTLNKTAVKLDAALAPCFRAGAPPFRGLELFGRGAFESWTVAGDQALPLAGADA